MLFLSFRHFFHDRIVQFRKEHEENYGTMVQVINQHKRWMVFLIRLSAIPVVPPPLVAAAASFVCFAVLTVGSFFNAIVLFD